MSEVVGVSEARIGGIQNPPTKIKVVGGPKGFCIALPNYYPRNGGFHPRPQIGAQLALEDTVSQLPSVVKSSKLAINDFELKQDF